MFKKFKDKLAEEMKQSPARLQASMQQLAQAVVSPSLSNSSIQDLSSKDNFSLTDETDETPQNSPMKHGFQTVDLTPPSVNSNTSRRSSISSNVSDASFFFPVYESPGNMYHLQSDMDQSASEIDDNISPQLDRVSKEQLYAAYRKARTKYDKYRGRFTDLVTHYREIDRAKTKLESLLVETQDKALRRISDLKEQCQLEQQAKAHLEDALRNDIEEKDHVINSLRTKIKLIQEKDPSARNLEIVQASENHNGSDEILVDLSSNTETKEPSEESKLSIENAQLKDKLTKLESFLEKYKDMLKRNKDKILEITNEKNALERDYDILQKSSKENIDGIEKELNHVKEECTKLREEVDVLKKREEESVISLAENKLSIHRELEGKEEQIKHLQLELKQILESEKSLKETIELQKQELEKIKLVANQNAEASQEHLRGKSEALKKLQSEMQQKLIELEEEKKIITSQYETETIQKFTEELLKKENLIKEINMKKEECERHLEQQKSRNTAIEKELIDVKSIVEKIRSDTEVTINAIRDNYEKELHELKRALEIKDDMCTKFNNKNQEYAESIEQFKQKLLMQDEEIKTLKNKANDGEKLLRLQDELENKNIEILGLNSELKSCSKTNTDLKKEINNLVNQKNNTMKHLKIYKKALKKLKQNYATLKGDVENSISEGKRAISDSLDETFKSLSSVNQENGKLLIQVDELIKKVKTFEEHDEFNNENKILLEKIENEKISLEKELKDRINEIEDLKLKINTSNELETEKNKFALEIEQLNSKLSDLEQMCNERDQSLVQAQLEKETALRVFSTEKQQNEAILQDLNLQISEKETLYKEFVDLSQKLQEAMETVQNLKLENEDLKRLSNKIQALESERNSISEELNKRINELEYGNSLNQKNMEQLHTLQEECDNYKKSFEKNQETISTLTKELQISLDMSAKSTIEFEATKNDLQKALDSKQEIIQKFKALREKLQKTIEDKKNLETELEQEKLRSRTEEDKLNDSLNIARKENDDLKKYNSKISLEIEEISKSKAELDILNNEKTIVIEELNDIKSVHDLLKDENKRLKNNESDLLKLNEVLNQSQNNICEKLRCLEEKNSDLLNENRITLEELETCREQLKQVNSEIVNLNMKLNEFEEIKCKNNELTALLEKSTDYEKENTNLSKEIQKLTLTNESLNLELENLKSRITSLEESNVNSGTLENELKIQECKNTELENTLSLKIQELHSIQSNSESQLHDLKIELEEKNGELKVMELKNTKLLEEIDELSSSKLNGEDKTAQEIKEWQERANKFEKNLSNKESEFKILLENYSKLEKELANIHQSKDEDLMRNIENVTLEKRKLESQLDETLVTFQAKETQMQAINEELRNQVSKSREKLKTIEEEQSLRLKQIVKEFQAQLHDKEQELQSALEKRFDRQQNYESDTIQEYKEQLRDFQIELTKKSQEIEKLTQDNDRIKTQTRAEINKLLAEMNLIKVEHSGEIRDMEQKLKNSIKQKMNQIENKHEEEISELTNEWQNERKTVSNSESVVDEELENTTRVAMATVQSNTGSFHTLQQTLLSQKRELSELRKLVKIRQESVEDSTEIEYLRNILYKYMMGKETMVLAKVIAAVVKFDQEQTSEILKKEEDKLSLLGSLGLT